MFQFLNSLGRQIAKHEAGPRGFSQVLIKAMEEYNKRHGIGNPQLLITHYTRKSNRTHRKN